MIVPKTSIRPRRYGILLLPGFSNLCLANAVEPLRAANEVGRRALYQYRLLSLEGGPVAASSGIQVDSQGLLAEAGRLDGFFVIAGVGYTAFATSRIKTQVRRAAMDADLVGGLDTGAWVLGAAGLLDGRRATIHWQEQERLSQDFPAVTVTGTRYVVDREVITVGGATTVLDLMLWLLRRDVGEVLALDVMRLFLYDHERPGEHEQQGMLQAPFIARAPKVAAAIAVMEQALEAPRPLSEVAVAAGCSPRGLQRAFERALGMTPQRYYLYLRLSAGRRLIGQGGLGLAQIAAVTGFSSASTFARAYRSFFGHSPRGRRSRPTGSGASGGDGL